MKKIEIPTEWSSSIVIVTLDNRVTEEKVTVKPPKVKNKSKKLKVSTKMIFNGCFFNTKETSLKFCE